MFLDPKAVFSPISSVTKSVSGSFRAAKRNLSQVYDSPNLRPVKKYMKALPANVAKGTNELFSPQNAVRTVKATTRNFRAVTSRASLAGGAGVAIASNPLIGISTAPLMPALAAVTAFDATLYGVTKLEDVLFPDVEVSRIEEGEFNKESAVGQAAEQFLRGDISDELPAFDAIIGATDLILPGKRGQVRGEAEAEARAGAEEVGAPPLFQAGQQ